MAKDRDWDYAVDRCREGGFRKDTVLVGFKAAIEGQYLGYSVNRNGNFTHGPYIMLPMWFGVFPWFSMERKVKSPGEIVATLTGFRKWVQWCVVVKLRTDARWA